MPDNKSKRCPQCGGAIDIFGTCRKCGREWSENLDEDERADGLPDGQQHPSEVKQVGTRKPRRNRFTKSSESADKYSLWRIDSANDDETEIIKKRSLMRLDSRRTYSALGLVSRAYEAQRGALLWLKHLTEFLSEDERQALVYTVELLKKGFADLTRIRQAKVAEAVQMEITLEKEHRAARTARIRLLGEEAKKRKEAAEGINPELQSGKAKQIFPHEDSEGFGDPDPVTIDPKALEQLSHGELLELAKTRLSNLDTEKALHKRRETPDDILDE